MASYPLFTDSTQVVSELTKRRRIFDLLRINIIGVNDVNILKVNCDFILLN